ncbi:hypothetical protein NIES4071_61260 [Calothrix sp. NIES-4071]|nr:hypothetical protein NIES4071_61260 [Calothrix sp. NIES-4071]BAZ60433.1 hypothetical protein NIES4105_61210 [Calothrix sp. NIES-4105]
MLLLSITSCAEALAASPFGKENLIESNSAIFVSKQAPVMISILNPERLQSLDKPGYSFLKADFFKNSGFNFREDVQPWLGNEVTLAVTSLDFDRDPDNGKLPGYLLAMATKSPEKSREFVQLFFSKRVLAGAELSVEEFAGIKVISDAPNNKATLAGAVVGDKYVLFANDPKVLREAINNAQAPDLSLTSVKKYEDIKQVSQKSLGVAFFNLPIVAEWLGLKLPIQNFDEQSVALLPVSKGLLAQTVALSTQEMLAPLESLSKPVDALKYIPANVGIAVGSTDLSNLSDSNLAMFWQQLKSVLSPQGETNAGINLNFSNFVQQDAEAQKLSSIDLSKDIFNWVQGEYAIGLISSGQSPEWIFVTEKAPSTQEGIANLDSIAAKNGLSVTEFSLFDKPIVAWTQLKATDANKSGKPSFSIEAKAYGVHTTLDNYEIFTSSLETMYEVLTIKDNALLENRNFKNSIAALPESNAGYVYINWVTSQGILERQIPILKLLKLVAKPFFTNLRSLTITNYGSDTNSLKGDVFFQLEE